MIHPYTADRVPGVREFNSRLLAGGASSEFLYPESPVSRWLPYEEGRRLYNEFFLAVENDAVRGAYAIKRQEFAIQGAVRTVGTYHHPVSEGIVNRAYGLVGVRMLREALRRDPIMYGLGGEGPDKPLPRMLKLLGWTDFLVPLHFKVLRPARFLRNLPILREVRWRRVVADLAAGTGAGWLGIRALQWRLPVLDRVTVEEVPDFDQWADAVWERCKDRYVMTAVRDSAALRILFPAGNPRFVRIRVRRNGDWIGWAVVAEPNHDNPKLGGLRMGWILDCFGAPEDAPAIVRAAVEAFERRGVDLVASQQSHAAWTRALRRVGFLNGPSNTIFAASPELTRLLAPLPVNRSRIHFNRSDGDGLYQYV